MQRLSYMTETVLSHKITRNRIVLSFKDSPRNPLGRRPNDADRTGSSDDDIGGESCDPIESEREIATSPYGMAIEEGVKRGR